MKRVLLVVAASAILLVGLGRSQEAGASGSLSPGCWTCEPMAVGPTAPMEWECGWAADGESGEGIYCYEPRWAYGFCSFTGGACLMTVVNGGGGGGGGGVGGSSCTIPVGGFCPAECFVCSTYLY